MPNPTNKDMKKKCLIFPLFLPMRGCPGRCLYCDQNKITGSGDLDLARTRAEVGEFIRRNPGREKQVAFYGGSFTALKQDFREDLICLIQSVSDPLTTIRISTHPLYVGSEILNWCKDNGIRTIELGIQDWSDEVLAQTGRGYTGAVAMEAALRVKDRGFELGVQLMPGLPGWSMESIQINHAALVKLKPALMRLYPLIVIKGTPLEELFRRGEYTPLSLEQAVQQCADYFPLAEANGIKIIKLGLPSNISPGEIVAGPWHPAFGEIVKAELIHRTILSADPNAERIGSDKKERDLLRLYDREIPGKSK